MKKSLMILMIALVAISLFVGCDEPGIKSYTVTFETGNETVIQPQTVVEGGKVTKPSDLTRTGYTFDGWYDGDTKFDFSTAITKNYDLKAKWTLNTYQVTFDSDGGTPASYDAKSANYNGTITAPTEPTKTGYTFQGWYDGDTKFEFTTAITKNYELKAKWTINTYQVTFDSDGGTPTSYDAKSVDYNGTITAPADPTKTGYTFQGWYDGDTKFEFTTAITKNYDLKAKWTLNTYQVTFDSDGGTPASYDAKSVNHNGTITAPTEPTKTGYTFGGWYEGDTKFEFSTAITKNYDLKAKWRVLATYTVTFNVDGVTTTVSAQTVTEGGTASEPTTTPTKSGWIFDHWAKEENGSTAFDFTTSIYANTPLYAVFRNYYKVGDTGPAGGTIIYDCDADNTTEDADGADNLKSDVCGWRYLEAAPTDAPSNGNAQQYTWGPSGNQGTGIGIGDGWKNAVIFMDEVGGIASFPAAKACDDYSVTVGGVTYDDWFLPSRAELQLIYNNKTNISGFLTEEYVSSSGAGDANYGAVWIIRRSGSFDVIYRYGARYVRPVRAFLTADTLNPPVLTNPTPQYTVSFNVNGGTGTVDSQTVKKGRSASMPSVTPTISGKYITFAYWSLDGTTEYKFSENTISGDTELKAVYKEYALGSTGPAGGKIFYVNENYDETSVDNNWKYLEAAPTDITKTQGRETLEKFVFGYYPEGTHQTATELYQNTAIGKGKSNTTKLVAALGTTVSTVGSHGGGAEEGESTTTEYYAAKLCADYEVTYNGTKYDDWFLPSKDELGQMYTNRAYIGNLRTEDYWSSSEFSEDSAIYYSFWSGNSEDDGRRSEKKYVRPIRSF